MACACCVIIDWIRSMLEQQGLFQDEDEEMIGIIFIFCMKFSSVHCEKVRYLLILKCS